MHSAKAERQTEEKPPGKIVLVSARRTESAGGGAEAREETPGAVVLDSPEGEEQAEEQEVDVKVRRRPEEPTAAE
eukprot:4991783-Amphidinium_carterae.1